MVSFDLATMMLRRDPKFRALKVGGHGLLGSASYWLGPDHLLIVSTSSYTESYRRFFFNDIQAIVCQHTVRAKAWSVALAACVVVSLGLSLALYLQGGDALIWMFFCLLAFLVAGILLLINALRGPSCVAHISTAVQTTPLPYVSRWRRAQRLVNELKPRIEASQNALNPVATEAPSAPVQPETPNG
jgi:hypothetical protein